MKKSVIITIAAAMILSMAGCSDSAKGTAGKDISVASQKEPGSSLPDKLTPPMTIAQEFAKGKYDDYRYFSTAEEYDSKAKVNRSYKGEITADEFRSEIFETLCRIIGNGETTLKDGQRATQSEPELIIAGKDGTNYVVYKCIITNNDNEAGGMGAYAFSSKGGTMYFTEDSVDSRIFDSAIRKGVISDKNLVKKEDKVPVYNEKILKIIDANPKDLTFIGGKQTVNDKGNYVVKTYEGEIEDNVWKSKIFAELCDILKQDIITLKGEQDVQGGASSILTLKGADIGEISIGKGILIGHPGEEGGSAIYVVTIKQGGQLYFGGGNKRFEEFVHNAVIQSEENLVTTVKLPKSEIKKSDVKPQFPLTYIKLRTNYAHGEQINGTCTDAKGDVYSFDFSKTLPAGKGELMDKVIKNLKDGIANIIKTGAQLDASILEQGAKYAAMISPNAEFSCEHKMCDYGQVTLYAVVDGKAVKLYSKGDNDEFTDDVNAQKAIECFRKACDKPIKSVAIPD